MEASTMMTVILDILRGALMFVLIALVGGVIFYYIMPDVGDASPIGRQRTSTAVIGGAAVLMLCLIVLFAAASSSE